MGGPAPGDRTFGPWLKRQSVRTQNDILGRGKAELYRRGKVPIEKFSDVGAGNAIRALTLPELEAIERGIKKPRPKPKPKPKPQPKKRRPAIDIARERTPKPAAPSAAPESGRDLRLRLEKTLEDRGSLELTDSLTKELKEVETLRYEALKRFAKFPKKSWPPEKRNFYERTLQPLFDRQFKLQAQIAAGPKSYVNSAESIRQMIAKGGNWDLEIKLMPANRARSGDFAKVKVSGRSLHSQGIEGGSAKSVDDATDFLRNLVRNDKSNKVDVYGLPDKGDDARAFSNFFGISIRRSAESARTVVHELCHQLEDSVPRIKEAATAYRRYRAMKKVRKIQSDGSRKTAYAMERKLNVTPGHKSEVGYHDEFISPYQGKVYGHGSTEMITMYTEELYANPLRLMRQDPRGFEFIIDTLRGVPLKNQSWWKALTDAERQFIISGHGETGHIAVGSL